MVSFGLATWEDATELAALFERFFAESDYPSKGIVYSRERAEGWLASVMSSGFCPHIVARIDNRIVGAVSYMLDDTFSEQPVAVMNTIYVEPEFRRSAIGRVLVSLAADAAAGDGACYFNAPVSNASEAYSLRNLFTRAGFAPAGFIMGRRI